MVSLCREDGSNIRGHAQVTKEVISHFQKLLSFEDSCPYPGKLVLEQFVSKSLNAAQIFDSDKEVTCDKIRSAFLSIHPNKAPRPDGFNGYFFKKAFFFAR